MYVCIYIYIYLVNVLATGKSTKRGWGSVFFSLGKGERQDWWYISYFWQLFQIVF